MNAMQILHKNSLQDVMKFAVKFDHQQVHNDILKAANLPKYPLNFTLKFLTPMTSLSGNWN